LKKKNLVLKYLDCDNDKISVYSQLDFDELISQLSHYEKMNVYVETRLPNQIIETQTDQIIETQPTDQIIKTQTSKTKPTETINQNNETINQNIESTLTEKLPSSTTPVLDAFICCAICNWGVSLSLLHDLPIFTISDLKKYWEYSQLICSKPNPTQKVMARLKALKKMV